MKNIFTVNSYDFRNTFREPVFRVILFFPLIAFSVIKWGYPFISGRFDLGEEYNALVVMWGSLQSGIMFGFIYGFLMLEEKEENLFAVLKILPVSLRAVITGRLLSGITVSASVSFLMIHYGGLIKVELLTALLLAVQFSLSAPLIAVILAVFSRNRIEGMAVMKIVNMLLIAPGLIYLFPSDLLHISALVPTYWMFRAIETAGTESFPLYFLAGYLYPSIVIWLLSLALQKKIGN
ncbi:MAG: hypothetical protein AMXMBFR48_23180 [Ignavibacteriales bacterium]